MQYLNQDTISDEERPCAQSPHITLILEIYHYICATSTMIVGILIILSVNKVFLKKNSSEYLQESDANRFFAYRLYLRMQ